MSVKSSFVARKDPSLQFPWKPTKIGRWQFSRRKVADDISKRIATAAEPCFGEFRSMLDPTESRCKLYWWKMIAQFEFRGNSLYHNLSIITHLLPL
jgi:hypothetical protein